MFCHAPWPNGFAEGSRSYTNLPHALDRWLDVLPDFRNRIQNAHVMDFGCGEGFQMVAMAEAGAASVLGVEIELCDCQVAAELIAASPAGAKMRIEHQVPPLYFADVITSQNSFEHFMEAEKILTIWKQCLSPNGQVLITFAPPWYSPWGAHMAYFCRLPWVHLFFSEEVVMHVRRNYRDDGASTYSEAQLSQMSLSRFERLVRNSGFALVQARYDCSWGLDFLRGLPLLRELFVNRVTAVLKHPAL